MATNKSRQARFVSLKEGAEYAGVPTGTLRDWIRRGILPGYRLGPRLLQVDLNDIDQIRIRVRAVEDWLHDEVLAAYDEMKAHPDRGVPAQTVRARFVAKLSK